MAKLLLTFIIFLYAVSSYAFRFLSLGHPRKIRTQLHCTPPDELSAIKSKISAVEYCLANFGNIVIPETGEKNAVMIYKNFGLDGLMDQLGHLQAEKLNLQAEKLNLQAIELELVKQNTILLRGNSTRNSTRGIFAEEASAVWKAIVEGKVIQNPNNTRLWRLPDGISWMGRVGEFYNRECYDKIIADMSRVQNALVIGTPGIGKTQFLQSVLVHLAQRARSLGQDPPSIHYQTKSSGNTLTLSFLRDGSVVVVTDADKPQVEYVLSDSVDLEKAYGTVLNLEVASDKEANYNTFLKRIEEDGGDLIVMPVFSFDELKCIQPTSMTNKIAKFRYDVYGGSARNFQKSKEGKMTGKQMHVVKTVLGLLFHDIKVEYPDDWMTVAREISQTLLVKRGPDSVLNVVNSMMRHTLSEEVDDEDDDKFWASPFMKFLGAAIVQDRTTDIVSELNRIIGKSGEGNLFEYLGHLNLLKSRMPYLLKPLLPSPLPKSMPKFPKVFFNLPVARFNTVEEVANIPDGCYGLPMIENFPLVDAVLQPNVLIQFTISPSGHKTKSTPEEKVKKLKEIRAGLNETDESKHKMVFVIPKKNIKTYKFDKDLSAISQFVCLDVENSVNPVSLMSEREKEAWMPAATTEMGLLRQQDAVAKRQTKERIGAEKNLLRQQDAVAKRQTKEGIRAEKNLLADSKRELKKRGETQSH